MVKLNVGCGGDIKQGYVNIDLHNPKADLKHDLTQPLPYPDSSVEEIQAIHIIEHFTRREWERVRRDWFRVLSRGGTLFIRCPDLEECMHAFLENKGGQRWGWWVLTIFGGQEEYGEGQLHKNGFTLDKLVGDLKETGFQILQSERVYQGSELRVLAKKP